MWRVVGAAGGRGRGRGDGEEGVQTVWTLCGRDPGIEVLPQCKSSLRAIIPGPLATTCSADEAREHRSDHLELKERALGDYLRSRDKRSISWTV